MDHLKSPLAARNIPTEFKSAIIHAYGSWHDSIANGAHDFFKKLDDKLTREGISVYLADGDSRTSRALLQDPHIHIIVGGPPMFGAQQIPGVDATLRVSDVSFEYNNYARCEIVKASSALPAANTIINNLIEYGILPNNKSHHSISVTKSITNCLTGSLNEQEISQRAEELAVKRSFPKDMAGRTNSSIS